MKLMNGIKMKKLYFYNNFHYGDCLASLHFLIHLSEVNDIVCDFMCKSEYHSQLSEFISSYPKITLSNLPPENYDSTDLRTHIGFNRAINLWCCPSVRRIWGDDIEGYPVRCENFPDYKDIHLVLFEVWKFVCETNDLICPFKTKEETIFDQEIFSKDTLEKEYDFLLINSYGLSGQMEFYPEQQDDLFEQIVNLLQENNKSFILSQKIKDYECTVDYKLSLTGIGQLAKKCKVILGIPTSPFFIALNKWSMEKCVKFVNYAHNGTGFDCGPKFTNIKELDDLYEEVCNLIRIV